jgi:hypothetical protein
VPIYRAPAYLTPPQEWVTATPWQIRDGANQEAVGDEYAAFDPAVALVFTRTITFEQPQFRRASALSPHDVLGVAGFWSSSTTGQRGASPVAEIDPGARETSLIQEVVIPPGFAGGRVDLRSAVVLARPVGDADEFAARGRGSVLWRDAEPHRVFVEGNGTRFPVDAIEFGSGNRFPRGAMYLLEWDSGDLNLPFLGSVRLHVNTGHPKARLIREPDGTDEAIALSEQVRFDVARQLVSGALRNKEFVDGTADYADESVGRVVLTLCRQMLFQHSSIARLAGRLQDNPSTLEAELQAALRLHIGSES